MRPLNLRYATWIGMAAAMLVTSMVYWPGLHGGWLFDDYPNIVDNPGIQLKQLDVASLVRALLSSPSSEFKRPLASLSFALNYLASGLDPFWMKLTNLVIHLLNGALAFLLTRLLLREAFTTTSNSRREITAILIATAWMLLPINLTAVLYTVQRMESMANLFVLLGLIGYVSSRHRMLASTNGSTPAWDTALCFISIVLPTAAGITAKETAVMLPLYAFLIEWCFFGYRNSSGALEWRVVALFTVTLFLPTAIGLSWLLPGLLNPNTWAVRNFDLNTRLLSEARIIVDYVIWTLLPAPDDLSFYHDNFCISTGLLSPWSTLTSLFILVAMITFAIWQRSRRPLASLGILLFLACHLLTGTIIPLELIYEHRNYFASFGLLLAVVPELMALPSKVPSPILGLASYVLLGMLTILWTAQTALTASAWGDPLKLAETLADRAPDSPRAQYELGRTYIIYSQNDPNSQFTQQAYAPLERAAAIPGSSILAEQALIFMNSRMHVPLKDAWWDSLIAKLKARKATVQDGSSLLTLTQCARDGECDLPTNRMIAAFTAALSHPDPDARLLSTYSDYAWNVLGNQALGEHMIERAIDTAPSEPAYRITQIRMLLTEHRKADALEALNELKLLNIGGRLDDSLKELQISATAR